jgi:hypothetical protein
MPVPANSQTTKVSFSSTADIVAAVTGQRVYVYDGEIVASAGVTVDLQDGSTSLAGVMTLIAGTPLQFKPRPDGMPIFTTTLGNAFHAVQVGAGQVSGYFRTFQG